ncbi:MAG: hypothetical protein UY41_C0028G0003 [Candidatus Moranbacteria bacterium GW2011_GWE1_49_15]|nr:MAG: hypothetical protein UX75_C0028G0016 [Candidatus Moranbacteria bacterium GW2011_GWE2_47_10]KKW06352.1 MAG: hypothetical protein UY41_C0028G0003 [Candidatus Moranbacteria bacterium GW2011_GWE1_49_15]HBP01516.1 hypothetical protein [Candidatus Moranbacteria bacterium]
MNFEFPAEKKEIFLPKHEEFEFSLGKQEDLEKLESWLGGKIGTEEAAQCVFVLRSMAAEDFVNHCNDATKEFGIKLSQKFGGEESFFDLVPDAAYSDAKSRTPLAKIGYRKGDFHSVGLLEMNLPDERNFTLAFDLTYGDISGKGERDSALVLYSPGGEKRALEGLSGHYGGSWETDFEFDRETGRFISKD